MGLEKLKAIASANAKSKASENTKHAQCKSSMWLTMVHAQCLMLILLSPIV